jgi:hypothetical protein
MFWEGLDFVEQHRDQKSDSWEHGGGSILQKFPFDKPKMVEQCCDFSVQIPRLDRAAREYILDTIILINIERQRSDFKLFLSKILSYDCLTLWELYMPSLIWFKDNLIMNL